MVSNNFGFGNIMFAVRLLLCSVNVFIKVRCIAEWNCWFKVGWLEQFVFIVDNVWLRWGYLTENKYFSLSNFNGKFYTEWIILNKNGDRWYWEIKSVFIKS